MNRRSFIKRIAMIGAALGILPRVHAKAETLVLTGDERIGLARIAGETVDYVIAKWDSDGILIGTPGWKDAEVFDLDTGKPLQYAGKNVGVVECSAREGWAIVSDYCTPKGEEYLDKHNKILRVRLNGRYQIVRSK